MQPFYRVAVPYRRLAGASRNEGKIQTKSKGFVGANLVFTKKASTTLKEKYMSPILSTHQYRLVTRSDFDGLVCAVLFKELGMVNDILFVHPKDMQDGKIEISSQDITTNLPYVAQAHLAFDHHLSETIRNTGERSNHIIIPSAPSAARVVYDYYGGKARFPTISDEMMLAVDQEIGRASCRERVLNLV